MTVTAEDVRIELQRDSLSEAEEAFIEKKISEYALRADRINPTAPEHIKDEYVMAGVLQALVTDYEGAGSFSDGRFSVTTRSIRENPAVDRFKGALLRLQGIRIWKPRKEG